MVTLTALQPRKLVPRVDMEENQLRREFFTKALTCEWEMAAECPCGLQLTINAKSGTPEDHRSDCDECKQGILYHSKQTIPVLVLSGSVDPKRWTLWGESAHARVKFTFLPEHLPSFYDKITVLDALIVFRETQKRRAAIDKLRFPVQKRTVTVGDPCDPACPVEREIGVLYARRADPAGNLLPGEMVEGTDFEVTDDGSIDWTLGDGLGTSPAVGSKFSMQYHAHPKYIVTSHPYSYRRTYEKIKKPDVELKQLLVHAEGQLEFYGRNAETPE